MRILLDECVHIGVKADFSGHIVKTVTEIGWASSKDGPHIDPRASNELTCYLPLFENVAAASVRHGSAIHVFSRQEKPRE